MSSVGAVAERYAQAIFELGVQSGSLANLVTRFAEFAATYSSSLELQSALASPLLPKVQRDELLTAVAAKTGLPELGTRAVLIMASRGKLPAIVETSVRLTQMYDAKEGVVRAQVTTATAMPEAYYEALSTQLERATQRKIVLERDVDPELVAGAIARVGDAVIDASVQGRLNKLQRDVLSALSAESL